MYKLQMLAARRSRKVALVVQRCRLASGTLGEGRHKHARLRFSTLTHAAAFFGAVFGLNISSAATANAQSSSGVAIYPLTNAAAAPPVGYFIDPFPITPPNGFASLPVQFFSGTTESYLACPDQVPATCAEAGEIVVDSGVLETDAQNAGVKLIGSENLNVGFDGNAQLQMVLTYKVENAAGATWTVIAHAHPDDGLRPLKWTADRLLVGSLSTPQMANYDGKFFVDGGKLYLIFSANLLSVPQRDGLVAQLMSDPLTKAASPPVTLLAPAPNAGFVSEDYIEGQASSGFKLVETGNIAKIGGKYALAYSTGAYNEADYKAGVAWSDTFLPQPGETYRKVLQNDPTNIWGSAGGVEVRYLLQSQKPAWPNDVGAVVIGPGVPSLLQAPDGAWRLVVAGYSASDAPMVKLQDGRLAYNSAYRRPYVVPLTVTIPPNATVAGATNAELAKWVVPKPN